MLGGLARGHPLWSALMLTFGSEVLLESVDGWCCEEAFDLGSKDAVKMEREMFPALDSIVRSKG